jgi:hypothetical protein
MQVFDELILCEKTIRLSTRPMEMRMSTIVESPVIYTNRANRLLLDFSRGGWHLDSFSEQGRTLQLVLNRYPDKNKRYLLYIDFLHNTVDFEGQSYRLPIFAKMLQTDQL